MATLSIDGIARKIGPVPRSGRAVRYTGDDRAVPIDSMIPRDRDATRALYALLSQFERTIVAAPPSSAAAEVARSFDLERAFNLARSLGREGHEQPAPIRRTIHDLRGGALLGLLLEVQRARAGDVNGIHAVGVLTATHLKIMRSAVLGLDDARRAADSEEMDHSIERLQDAVQQMTGRRGEHTINVNVRCEFSGPITACCLELGALDRAALNLINNAVQYTTGDDVDVVLISTTGAEGGDLRICVANAIDAAHAADLHDRLGEDLGRLFVEPFSTSGSGDGLKICAQFVSAAYGIAASEGAVEARLVGALVDELSFVSWMHWPAVS